MNEHTPSLPFRVDRNDMESGIDSRKRCIICGSVLENQRNQDYYTCEVCGFMATEFTREP